jgi:hypothetical protein
MSEQVNGKHINIEQLISQRKQVTLTPINVDALTLVQGVTHNVTLVKDVWTDNTDGQFDLFAAFGPPESDQWLVILALEE